MPGYCNQGIGKAVDFFERGEHARRDPDSCEFGVIYSDCQDSLVFP